MKLIGEALDRREAVALAKWWCLHTRFRAEMVRTRFPVLKHWGKLWDVVIY